jgi:hypothetical protein
MLFYRELPLIPVDLECVHAEQWEGCTAVAGQVMETWHLLKVNKNIMVFLTSIIMHFPEFSKLSKMKTNRRNIFSRIKEQ